MNIDLYFCFLSKFSPQFNVVQEINKNYIVNFKDHSDDTLPFPN